VGPGKSKHISLPGFEIRIAGLLPDGNRIWFNGSEGSQGLRFFLTDINGAKPRAITPTGVRHASPSLFLNGKYLAGRSQTGPRLYPIQGGEPIAIPSKGGEFVTVAGASENGQTLFLASEEIPSTIFRYDLKRGREELMMQLAPVDRAGVLGGLTVQIAPDGRSYAYSYPQELSELQWIEGLK
jgi:hypothetical protein